MRSARAPSRTLEGLPSTRPAGCWSPTWGTTELQSSTVGTGSLTTSITDEIHIPFGFCVAGTRTWVVSSSRQFDGDCGVTAYVDDAPTITLGYGQHSVFGAMSNPAHVAVDRSGLVLVSDPDFGFVQRFRPSGPFVGEFGTSGKGLLRFPHGVVVGRNGDTYVADTGNGRIARFGGAR